MSKSKRKSFPIGKQRKPQLELLETRRLLTASGENAPVSLNAIHQYGSALFGFDWDSHVGLDADQIQQHIHNDTWRSMLNDSPAPTIARIREEAKYLGAENLQAQVDQALTAADLSSIDIRQLDWLQEHLPGPAEQFDYFADGEGGDDSMAEGESDPLLGYLKHQSLSAYEGDVVTPGQHGILHVVIGFSGELPDGGSFTVPWQTVGQTATPGVDFTPTSGSVTFSDGAEGGGSEKTVNIVIINDSLDEPDETFKIILQGPVVEGKGETTVTIFENDLHVTIFDADPVTEGDVPFVWPPSEQPKARFRVTLSSERSDPVSIPWRVVPVQPPLMPATPGSDFIRPTTINPAIDSWLVFDPGETEKFIEIPIIGDQLYELTEYFYVDIAAEYLHHINFTVVNDRGIGTIIDNDPYPELSVNDVSVEEHAGTAVLTVTMTNRSSFPVSFDWAVTDQTAIHPDDYGRPAASGTRTIPAGDGPGPHIEQFVFTIVNDTLTEPDETFRLTISNAINATIIKANGIVTILANDPILSVNDLVVNEGQNAIFQLAISIPIHQAVSVNYATVNGSAIAPEDYTALSHATLVFAPGETSKTIVVATIDDTIPEPDQDFFLVLAELENAIFEIVDGLPRTRGRAVIKDDDPLDVMIHAVTFGGGNHTIHSDPDNDPNEDGNNSDARASRAYTGPHYLDFGNNALLPADGDTTDEMDRMYPVAYTRSKHSLPSYISVAATVEIRNSAQPWPGPMAPHQYPGPFHIRGKGPDGIEIGTLSSGVLVGVPATSVDMSNYLIPMTIATAPLDDKVRYYNTFDIVWEFSAETDATGHPIYISAGSSHNRLYVTLNDPLPFVQAGNNPVTPLLETVIHIGTTGADSKSNEDDAILGIWSKFSSGSGPANVHSVGLPVGGLPSAQPVSHALSYYKDYRCTNTTTATLIANHDGQCGSWAKFLIDTLRTQGINQQDEYVIVEPTNDAGFIVNNWNFAPVSNPPAGTAQHPWVNTVAGNVSANWELLFSTPSFNSYNWTNAEVTDTAGVSGQHNANPASLFGNHQFVRLTVGGVLSYFDPSYGVSYSSLLDFDDNYLTGYFIAFFDGSSNSTIFAFRKNVLGVLEVSELVIDL
jgi:hypothetical protein